VIRKGEPWGEPTDARPDVTVAGDDRALASSVADAPGALVRFEPTESSDLARALGLHTVSSTGIEVALDTLRVDDTHDGVNAVNAIVLGTRPDRVRAWTRATQVRVEVDGRERFTGHATTVVVANGQFVAGLDVVPRGHPGDGRIEVQVYGLARGERAGMRRRLPTGTHVPHPRIMQATGRRVVVTAERPLPLELDGRRSGRTLTLTVEVNPATLRLLL
jgi:diacylglycerol kinase family enzyme